jgi:hypothetical protein
MARRRKQDGILDDLHDLFMLVPAWMCLPIAGLVFVGVNAGLAVFAAANPVLRGIAALVLPCMYLMLNEPINQLSR